MDEVARLTLRLQHDLTRRLDPWRNSFGNRLTAAERNRFTRIRRARWREVVRREVADALNDGGR